MCRGRGARDDQPEPLLMAWRLGRGLASGLRVDSLGSDSHLAGSKQEAVVSVPAAASWGLPLSCVEAYSLATGPEADEASVSTLISLRGQWGATLRSRASSG